MEAATPGPWCYDSDNQVASAPKVAPYEAWLDEVLAGSDDADFVPGGKFHTEDYNRSPRVAYVPAHHGDTAVGQRVADAQFIAHAREDIPWLLAQLDAAEARTSGLDDRLAQLEEQYRASRDNFESFGSFGEAAHYEIRRQEVDRFRALSAPIDQYRENDQAAHNQVQSLRIQAAQAGARIEALTAAIGALVEAVEPWDTEPPICEAIIDARRVVLTSPVAELAGTRATDVEPARMELS